MSVLVDVADAVAAEINAATLSLDVDAVRGYETDAELEDLDELRLDVVPVRLAGDMHDRGSLFREVAVDVAIRKRFGLSDQDNTGEISRESIDELVDLLEEIDDLLAGVTRLSTYSGASWFGSEVRTPWMPDHLRQQRQYTGIVRVTYNVSTDVT